MKLYGNLTSTGLSFTFSTIASCFTDASPNVFDSVAVIYERNYKVNNIINPFHSGYRGSYMSAHVLLNLLNELRKRDKM